MDSEITPLYYVSSFAGLITVAGGIWLIHTQKIYIDKESKQITEVETPFGTFRTNIPALVLFVLGFIPLIYPIIHADRAQPIKINGKVKASSFPLNVYAVVELDSLLSSGEFSLPVPFLKGVTNYKVLCIAGHAIEERLVNIEEAKDGKISLREVEISGTTYQPKDIPPIPVGFTESGGNQP